MTKLGHHTLLFKVATWYRSMMSVTWLQIDQETSINKKLIDGLKQESRHSIANALELHLSCTNMTNHQYTVTKSKYVDQ